MEVPESNFHAESISGKIRFNKYNEKNEKEREKQNPTTEKCERGTFYGAHTE